MIRFFRSFFQSKIGLAITFGFIALVAVAFAASDVTGSSTFGGVGGDTKVAVVGGEAIGTGQFTQLANSAYNQVRARNPQLDMASFVDQGGLDEVLNQLIDSYALAEFGRKHGMAVSKRLVDSEIAGIGAFKNVAGQFDEAIFRRALLQQGVTESRIREDITRGLLGDQILVPATLGASVPANIVKPYADLILEARKGDIALIPSMAFLPKSKPDAKALAQFYKENAARYTVPERRVISYATFDTSRFRDQVKVSDAEVRKLFESRADQYAATEKKSFIQLIVPTQDAAKALEAKIKGGTTMQEAAKSVGLIASETMFQTRDEIASSSSADVAKAIFATQPGNFAPITQSGLGWHVVRVTEQEAVPAKTLAQVRADLEVELTREKEREAAAAFTEQLEDSFADGATLQEVAASEKLVIKTTPPLQSDGRAPDQPEYAPPAYFRTVLPAAFAMEEDSSPQLIEADPGFAYSAFAVDKIEPAAPPPLAKVRDQVEKDYMLAQGSKKARELADKVAKAAKSPAALRAALADATVKLPPIEQIDTTRRQVTQAGQRVPPPVALLFSMAPGSTKVLEAPNRAGWFIVRLTSIDRGDASNDVQLVQAAQRELGQVVANEYRQQFLAAVRRDIKIDRNPEALKKIADQLAGRGRQN